MPGSLAFRFLVRPWHRLRTRVGLGRSVERLAQRLEMPLVELTSFEPRYFRFRIPKRSGGIRELAVPSEATKALQHRLLRHVLAGLHAHPAACAFERGKSIADNAAPHAGQAVVIKLDVVNFFPSTSASRMQQYFQRIGYSRKAAQLLTRLTTHQDGLPQGAPTSPRLSNLVNFGIDVRLSNLASSYDGQYTRYADDITISLPHDNPRRVRGVIQRIRHILRSYGYELHQKKKLKILRRHHQQLVTGLVVNERVNLPRKKRRHLRAVLHRLGTGREATLSPEQLAGWKGVLKMISADTHQQRSNRANLHE
jgi:retron-type reverse transcriptase